MRLQQCPGTSTRCNVSISLPAHQVTHIPLTIDADNLPPDHYVGSIRFYLQGTATTLTVSIDLSVRYGPFWPIIIIFLGILFGRLAVQMRTPLAQKQIDLLPRYYSLHNDIYALPYNYPSNDAAITNGLISAKKALQDHLATLHAHIESSDAAQTEDAVTQEASDLENALSAFEALVTLKSKIEKEDPSNQDRKDYETALSNLAAWKISDVQNYVKTQQSNLNQETQNLLLMRAAGYVGYARKQAQANAKRRTIWGKSFARFSRGSAAFLAWITGHPFPDAELRYWFGRPLLELLLLILLPLLGLQTLYVNGSATFGMAGLYDFLTLFLWGLSADIAQRTLQNLPIGVGLPASPTPSPTPTPSPVTEPPAQT